MAAVASWSLLSAESALDQQHASSSVGISALPEPEMSTRVYVGIATRGRPATLNAIVGQIQFQTLRATEIIVSCTSPDDAGDVGTMPNVTVLIEKPGLARQRNAILRHLGDEADVVVFFDDDFVPHSGWIAAAVRMFREHPLVAGVTGQVVADGIKGPGIDFGEACSVLQSQAVPAEEAGSIVESYSPYGCNMAFRVSAIRGRRFDERLVLYGWLEDRDFGGSLLKDGWRVLKVNAARGVHMGNKTGRVAGHRLGYSQVMNPVYLRRKGTMAISSVADHIVRNVTANLLGSFSPEPYVDRRGRLWGNAMAFLDLLRGRLTPERAEQL